MDAVQSSEFVAITSFNVSSVIVSFNAPLVIALLNAPSVSPVCERSVASVYLDELCQDAREALGGASSSKCSCQDFLLQM